MHFRGISLFFTNFEKALPKGPALEKRDKKKHKNLAFRILLIIGKILAVLLLIIFLLLIFLRSEWGQGIIVDKYLNSLAEKTGTTMEVDRLFLTFSGDVFLEGLYLEDQKGDTLLYSRELQADIPFWPIISGGDITLRSLSSDGFTANIIREDSIAGFNYEFLLEALAPADTSAVAQPDTTAPKRNFIIGEIDVSKLDLEFRDAVAGMDTEVKVGKLAMQMRVFDLVNMTFHASEARLANADIYYSRKKPFPEKDNEEEVPLPYLMVDELQLNNLIAYYESVPDGILAEANIADLSLRLPEADLNENIILVEYFHMKDSEILLTMTETSTEIEETPPVETEGGFQWPAWTVEVQEIVLDENTIAFSSDGQETSVGTFNPQAVQVEELSLNGREMYLRDQSAGAKISALAFKEASGLEMTDSEITAQLDEKSLQLTQLDLHLNNNSLEGTLDIGYPSLQDLIDHPEKAVVQGELPEIYLDINDVFLFQPALRNNEYIRALARKKLSGSLNLYGTLASLEVSPANISWGGSTNLYLRGELRNLTSPDKLYFSFPSLSFSTRDIDVSPFIKEDSLGIDFPQQLQLKGSLAGTLEEMSGNLKLWSSEGSVELKGGYDMSGELAFDVEMETLELDLGAILNNEQIGQLSLRIRASGQGENLNTLDASLDSEITSFYFNNYHIDSLEIKGKLVDGKGPIYSRYRDDNLNLQLENFVILDTVASQVNVNLDVPGANLQALGLTSRLIKVGFGLDASFRGDGNAFDVNAEIVDGVTVYGNKSYLLGDFLLSARVRPDSTALDIDNQLLDLSLRSNTDPASFANALQRHYRSYLYQTPPPDTMANPVNLHLQAEIREGPILEEVFIAQLEELDTVKLMVDFDEGGRQFVADISIPYLNYMGAEIDSLSFDLTSDQDSLDFEFGFNGINAGPLAIQETALTGSILDKILHLDFNAMQGEETLVHFQSEITRKTDTLSLWLDPSKVVLNKELWEVPESNTVWIAPNYMSFQDFNFIRPGRRMEIVEESTGEGKEDISLSFENFSLFSFLSYLNPTQALAEGNISGFLTVEDPFGVKGLIADIDVSDFEVLEVPMGVLRVDAEALSYDDYNFALAIEEGNIDLDLTGGFTAAEDGAEWFTELDLHRVNMEVLEAFSFGEIKDSEGSFSGKVNLSGTFVDPYYEGNFTFDQVGFTLAKLNAPFRIESETLSIDTTGFAFDNFQIEDTNSNLLTLNGDVTTSTLLNPEFDLAITAEDFMLLNSTAEDSDLFYGTAVMDVDANLTGSLNVPNLQMDLVVKPETRFTYIIPESEVGIERREGIIAFVNREDPDAILTATEKQAYASSGLEMESTISIDDGAEFQVIIDEQTGDNLLVRGEGDLLFNIFGNGRMTLYGRYLMDGGHYEMNLYGLVNRNFEIVEGSSITWAGDPLDANLDLRARYRVETSASDLMASQLSGAATPVRNRFRQELPFLVYLNVGGQLMQPVLSFGLDMPEEEQGAIGGQVYGRVQQVNQQEQELNQQVFSLLVLNRFYPSTGSDGSGGGTLNIARDNLTDALSDQLNVLSKDIFGESDFALDFGLDSYTDYQGESPRERTQLDITAEQTFMDDRLVARVGSEVDILGSPAPGEETPLIGNVSLEYLIDENGTWRLRGFRSNRFENVIEGQVIVSGIALIFQREFNKFKELFMKVKDESDKDQQ